MISGQGAERASVLRGPELAAPVLGAVVYTQDVDLKWDVFEGAEAYWVEVALDPGFNQMQISEWGIRETGFAARLEPARYHWRVAALDRLGLPGEWSTAQDFTLRIDDTPPFLTVLSPADGALLSLPEVELLGVSEPDAAVLLNGQALEVSADGSFLSKMALSPGQNVLTLQATDSAGNVSTSRQTVVYRPAVRVEISLSDRLPRVGTVLASRIESLSVVGQTTAEAGAPVQVRGPDGAIVLQTLVGASGEIGFTVPVEGSLRRYSLQILAPDGTVEGTLSFEALRDSVPPQVTLDLPPPRATGDEVVELTGDAGDATRLDVNGTQVALLEGRFELTLPLQPGENSFDLVAADAVGNVSAIRLQTLLDVDPPDILRVELGRPQGEDGPIELLVEARDASGLVQAAPFVISIDGVERDGYLRCEASSGLCRVSLPAEPGALRLIELAVEDYAGNTAFE